MLLRSSSLATAEGPQGGLAGAAVDMMETLGAPGAGAAVALENVFPPIPSEVILPLAGFTAAQGEMALWAAILWTTIGSIVGALALYGLGASFGQRRTRGLLTALPLVHARDVDKAEAWFERHGTKAVLLGRMVPVVRSLVSLPAGVERMPLAPFVALTALGSLVWNSALVLAGYQLGARWEDVEPFAKAFQIGVVVTAVAVVALFVARRLRQAGGRVHG